jgi:long-subunit fatty acid transport protein
MKGSITFARNATARAAMLLVAVAMALTLSAATGFAQGINYPVGSPGGTSGAGNARTDPDNFFMRNNVAGLTEIPVNAEEENSGELGTSGKGGWRIDGELQESVYHYERLRLQPGPFMGLKSKATIVNPGLAGEMTYTSGSHRWAIGFGGYQMFGFQSKFVESPMDFGSRAQFFDTRVASNDIAMGGAVRLTKKLSVGGAFIVGRGFLDLKAPTLSLAFFGIIRQSRLDVSEIGAPGVNISVHYRPFKTVNFGLNYKSKRDYNLHGEFETFALSGFQFVPVVPKVTVPFKLPTVAEGGVQIKPRKNIILEGDFRFYDYTATFKTLSVFDATTKMPLISQTILGKDVRSVRFGFVYSMTDKTKFFAGSAYTTNGFPEAAINPGLVNVGGLDISGGLGKMLFKQWATFSVAVIRGRERIVSPPVNPIFEGKYTGNGVLFSIGLRLKVEKLF